jgi:DNA-binding response OmpR family regulator/HPt (histidine-containing phosphotransfer) domain-containing protein
MKILIVEDDEVQSELLRATLTASRYIVDIASDGLTGWDYIQTVDYDLIVLDVMLPYLDGVSLCKRIRAKGHQTLILLLTSKGSSEDKITGLDAGADDYLVKPIQVLELDARIRALLRRKTAVLTSVLTWGALQLDLDRCEVTCAGHPLTLTAKEYALLELLMRNPQRVYSQSSILNQLWSLEDDLPGEDTVRAHIKRLRQRLKSVGSAELIETVYGVGYRLNPALQISKTQISKTLDSGQSTDRSVALEPIAVIGEELSSQQLKLKLLDRAIHLERLITTFLQNPSKIELKQQAQQESHRLIGSLGMVGLLDAAEMAQRIEMLLKDPGSDQPLNQTTLEELLTLLKQSIEASKVASIAHTKASQPNSPNGNALPDAKVLIVDDDRFTLKLLQNLLEPWGLQVNTLSHPLQFWQTLEAVAPDLLILDVQMPDTDGIELCKSLRNDDRWSWLPILFLTGQRDSETIQEIFKAGADDYVSKPVLAPELITRIFNRLERTRLLRQSNSNR